MNSLIAFFTRLFRRNKAHLEAQGDFLPGERARTKYTGTTAQQQAWRGVAAKVSDRKQADKPKRSSEFDRLLQK